MSGTPVPTDGLLRGRVRWGRLRVPCLLVAIACLVVAAWGGLLRLSWQLPLPVRHANWISFHGPLMVSGFLGTLIGLERAVAIGRRWSFLAPLASGAGAALLAGGSLGLAAPLALVLAAFVLLAAYGVVLRREVTLYTAIQALGALAWLTGNVLWILDWPFVRIVLWWGAFLVWTVAGERLELGRLQPRKPVCRALLLVAVAVFAGGLLVSLVFTTAGERIAGVGLALVGLGLLLSDFAWRTVRVPGLPRFVALALLSGHAWLVVAGGLVAVGAPLEHGLLYDAALHSLFLGFVIAMVFGHAPIIFPAVLGRSLAYHPSFYIHLVVLELSLLTRVGGDLTGAVGVARIGGLGNAAALLVFLISTVVAIGRGRIVQARPAVSRPDS